MKLRVILLTHGGAEAVLENLLALDGVQVAGVFVETEISRRLGLREKIRRSVRYDGYAQTSLKLARKLIQKSDASNRDTEAIEDSRERICRIAALQVVPVHFVANYHTDESIALMQAAKADLGVIYGTNIIKESVFKIPRLGSINLHQGLAPLYRGGPPVFWELFNNEHEVGITAHFVAAKVDTGEIILQEVVPLKYDYSYGLDFDAFIACYRGRLGERCARLVADAVRVIGDGSVCPRPQDISVGKRYRLPTKKEKNELRRRLRARRRNASPDDLLTRHASVEDQ